MRVGFSRVLLASALLLLARADGFAQDENSPAPVLLTPATATTAPHQLVQPVNSTTVAPVAQPANSAGASPRLQAASSTGAPPEAQPTTSTSVTPDAGPTTTEIYRGTGTVIGTSPPARAPAVDSDGENDITLNFVNADVRDVAKAILGDFLKLNYAVGANVQGTVTIQTSRPLARDKVLPVLEQSLRLNGMALVKADEIYKVVPLADAPHESGATPVPQHGGLEPGYGVSIVPMKYVGASEMQRLLEPLAPAAGMLHTDNVRNVLIIQGTEQERRTMLDNISLFDVNWLAGMSFALYSPKYTDAQDLAKELDQIVGGRNGPLAGVVRFVPIMRLNAVLAISPQAKYLEQLQRWVQRLDRPGQGSDRRIFVYHVQNGRASDLARVLLKVLFGSNYESASRHAAPGGDVFATPSEVAGGTAATSPPNAMGTLQSPPDQGTSDNNDTSPSREMANVNITADEGNNALVVMATPQQYGVIENALRQLDTVPLQVLLEAAIAEVTLTDELKYGVQYFYQPSDKHEFTLSNVATSAIAPTYPGFSYIFSEGTNIKVILNALSTVTHVEVISSPQVLVLNNQTATLQVGNQVPIATAQQQSTATNNAPLVNTIEYHDTGVILKVTPRVNQGGMVMMDISQEVSDVSSTTTSTLDSPTIELRKINSTVAVNDSETVALGGLIKDSRTKSKDGIPFLMDIPLLGNLFRTTDNNNVRTELMVLITPHVVGSIDKARAVTEELRQKLQTVQPLFDRAK